MNYQEDERQMYDAVCFDCHQPCKIPFIADGKRPVRCKACFFKWKKENFNE
ncbi:MAG: DNA-directed RNA polymerase [Actinobacteria bacterium]|nr:DNA-directed RNA polymerase [Actinomycetota bacterium]